MGGGYITDRDGEPLTVLGAAHSNPYAVETMRQAYNNLYSPDIASLSPNYLYVRFLPQNPGNVKSLLDADLELWDFPLHYDLLSIGEEYHDPSVADSTYTWQYAVVPVGYIFPSVQYEILEQLALVPQDSRLAEEAFRLTSNDFDEPDEYDAAPSLVNGKFDFVLDHSSPDAPPGTLSADGCSCPLPNNVRKPSGCVRVQDNVLANTAPVREVEVITARTKFFGVVFHQKDYTDAAGCWLIDKKYHKKLNIWVKFESATCNVKTMKGKADLWGYTFPRRAHIGTYGGPNFNNIEILFTWTSSIDTKQFRNWIAATTNNSVYEFQGYCAANGLPSPPGDLKMLVTPWGGDGNTGATPMFDKMSAANQVIVGIPAVAILMGVFGVTFPPAAILGIAFGEWIAAAAPDIVLNVNEAANVNADDMREILYHELAHSTHFGKVGEGYWLPNIAYVMNNAIPPGNNPPYGTSSTPGSGRCAVIEAWGFQNGMWATHGRYGGTHTNPGFPAARFTWQALLEIRTVTSGYIAFGWQYDLQDNNTVNPPLVFENSTITDGVSGYTQAMIFGTMTPGMLSLSQQRAALFGILPPGNTPAAYTALSNSYGL